MRTPGLGLTLLVTGIDYSLKRRGEGFAASTSSLDRDPADCDSIDGKSPLRDDLCSIRERRRNRVRNLNRDSVLRCTILSRSICHIVKKTTRLPEASDEFVCAQYRHIYAIREIHPAKLLRPTPRYEAAICNSL